ncbi:TRAP transporter permease [Chachezhania sediminis]|uniref:TRAP transporter permease n=1 Tax=Chachezhania sediminis TaxID=2599291 RepID=UPI001E31DE56|nr:TRAP transporter fused permease subunit [Chachezhania sediminis]
MTQDRPSPMSRLLAASVGTGPRRDLEGRLGLAIKGFAVLTALYTVYAATMSTWDVLARTIVFLCLMLCMLFLVVGSGPNARTDRPTVPDLFLAAFSLACLAFFTIEMEEIAQRITLFDPMPLSYWIFGYGLLALSIEAARRTVGPGLTLLALAFMAYNLWGHNFDGPLKHGLITFEHFLDVTMFTTDGVFGAPIQVTATYAFLFVMFGTLLEKAGGGAFFFNIAAALTGRQVGGPAKVAVVSSGLFGMLSGSPTADVVTTGSVTIPVMKRLGYSPTLAGAVEVAASTGGSILPPVMGAAVFIMAEFTAIPYLTIVFAAAASAILYYMTVFLQVDLRSRKEGVGTLDPSTLPRVGAAFAAGWMFLIPLGVLCTALVMHYSPTYVALYGTAALLLTWLVRWRTFTLGALFDGIAQTTLSMVAVTGACAAAGMVIGGITMTGLSGKVSELLVLIAGSNELLTLIFAAMMTILLGMGMPTPAAYALAAALVAPTLVADYGYSLMQAHMFLLYFAVLSAMTPPVAVAAYAASGIAGANPVSIAGQACKLAVAAFVLPFAFMYAPGLLLQASPVFIVLDILRALVLVLAMAVAAEGYWRAPIPGLGRLALALGGLAMISPQPPIVAAGLVLLAIGVMMARNTSIAAASVAKD